MASKDLQIVRARSVRLAEPSSVISSAESAAAVNPMEIVLAALKRHWIMILIATAVSGGGAWLLSGELEVETVSGQLIFRAQQLPIGSEKIYSPPNPNAAAGILQSNELLQEIIDRHGLPTRRELMSHLRVSASPQSSTLVVDLTMEDRNLVLAVLKDIGDRFLQVVAKYRTDTLSRDADYITLREREARGEAERAAGDLFAFQQREMSVEKNDAQRQAEIQGLITRLSQAEASIEQIALRRAKIDLQCKMLADEIHDVEQKAVKGVLAGRREQFEGVENGFKRVSRSSAQKEKLLQELDDLEKELTASIELRHSDLRKVSEDTSDPGLTTLNSQKPDQSSELQAVTDPAADVNADATPEADWLKSWTDRILSVGNDLAPVMDSATDTLMAAARQRLSESARRMRELDLELYSIELEAQSVTAKERKAKEELQVATFSPERIISNDEREKLNDLNLKEKKHIQLLEQLDMIQEIRNCPIADYVISSAPSMASLEAKSNRKKLFVFSMFGCEVLLLSPLVLLELWRARAAPVTVLSRRWNLPVLGLQPAQITARGGQTNSGLTPDHDLRLMALRIQQSLFQPKGRVVLFSGLDHDESPLPLMRSLAECFVRREETVLVIQAFQIAPAEHRSGRRGQQHSESVRPGVAEFLSGEYDQISSLVDRTDTVGIDFLPLGSMSAGVEAMASSRMTALIDQCRDLYSMILVVGPSTLHPADLQMLAARADGIVFTVNNNSLRGPFGQEVISDLIELGAPILGFAEQPALNRKASRIDEWSLEASPKMTISA